MQYTQSELQQVERILRDVMRSISELTARVVALEQKAALMGGGGGGGSGSAAAFYVAFPTGTVGGATWSGGVPTAGVSFNAVVCQVSSTGITNLGSQSCWNWLAGGLVANQGVTVFPDGTGAYATASQSCV
jgi:hypothetical protein